MQNYNIKISHSKIGKHNRLSVLLKRVAVNLFKVFISFDENSLSQFFVDRFSIDAHFPLIPYAFPAKLTLFPRSFETFGRELRRISDTSGKVIYTCLILIRGIIKSYFYSKRCRGGDIPRFTGKSPPRIFVFSNCPDFPCM